MCTCLNLKMINILKTFHNDIQSHDHDISIDHINFGQVLHLVNQLHGQILHIRQSGLHNQTQRRPFNIVHILILGEENLKSSGRAIDFPQIRRIL